MLVHILIATKEIVYTVLGGIVSFPSHIYSFFSSFEIKEKDDLNY